MFAVKITGKITGAEFYLMPLHKSRKDAEQSIALMRAANPSSYTNREVVQIDA